LDGNYAFDRFLDRIFHSKSGVLLVNGLEEEVRTLIGRQDCEMDFVWEIGFR
jgi:hypothetical protein